MQKYLLTIISLLLFQSQALAVGGVTSNGGDSVAAEFSQIARQVSKIIATHAEFTVNGTAFEKAILTTWVVSKPITVLHGKEVDAINYPAERRIEINRKRWFDKKNDARARYVLVAHEYLGIMGVDDSRYQISERLFDIPGVRQMTIRCQAFADGILNFSALNRPSNQQKNYYLELNLYDNQALAQVKNELGEVPSLASIGLLETMISGSLDDVPGDKKGVQAIIVINFGYQLRMVQVTISRNSPPAFRGKRWDVKSDARVSPIAEVTCEQIDWIKL